MNHNDPNRNKLSDETNNFGLNCNNTWAKKVWVEFKEQNKYSHIC